MYLHKVLLPFQLQCSFLQPLSLKLCLSYLRHLSILLAYLLSFYLFTIMLISFESKEWPLITRSSLWGWIQQSIFHFILIFLWVRQLLFPFRSNKFYNILPLTCIKSVLLLLQSWSSSFLLSLRTNPLHHAQTADFCFIMFRSRYLSYRFLLWCLIIAFLVSVEPHHELLGNDWQSITLHKSLNVYHWIPSSLTYKHLSVITLSVRKKQAACSLIMTSCITSVTMLMLFPSLKAWVMSSLAILLFAISSFPFLEAWSQIIPFYVSTISPVAREVWLSSSYPQQVCNWTNFLSSNYYFLS